MNYKQTVINILNDNESCRDDDQKLYAHVLYKLQFDVRVKKAIDLLADVKAKKIPSLDTITRLRRMSQMEDKSLRGELWDDRHGIKVDKALNDLGYVSSN